MSLRNEEVSAHIGTVQRTLDMTPERVMEDYYYDGVPGWKRALDITCIILAMPVLLPVMVGLALLIFCVSPGSVLYLQERVGYRGRRFICFKFRTMKTNADVEVHRRHLESLMQSDRPMIKMDAKGDPRLIPLGGALRATGLDELPQLLNVLGGQMSLVGPRPCLPYEYENYQPDQKRRFESVPGLTGLWQVSGKNKTTFSEMIALDIRYARTKSLRLDLQIMLKTVPALLEQVRETRKKRQAAQMEAVALHAPPVSPVALTPPESVNRLRVGAKLVSQK